MAEQGTIVNRVANSGLLQLDMADYFPKEEIVEYDIAQNLWQGIALKEKEFRAFIKENNWSTYKDKHVALTCSVEAIVPSWAYMLLSSALHGIAHSTHFGTKQEIEQTLLLNSIEGLKSEDFENRRIVIKGCGDKHVSEAAWVKMTNKLQPSAKSIMYGEPCSTVPVYKRPK